MDEHSLFVDIVVRVVHNVVGCYLQKMVPMRIASIGRTTDCKMLCTYLQTIITYLTQQHE